MSHHVAFVNHCGYGHVMPTLGVVAELVRRGHRVTYATAGGPVRQVAATGATVVPYESTLATVDLATLDTVDESVRLMPLLVMECEGVLAAMTEQFGGGRPDLVLYDATLNPAGRILSRIWNVPAAASFPTLMSNEHFSMMEKTALITGKRPDGRHPALAEFGGRLARLLAAYGQNDVSPREFHQFIERAEDLNLAYYPRSLQFAGDTFDERFVFVGPNLSDGGGRWTPPGNGKPVLVVSLGTSVQRRPGFFQLCGEAFRDTPWHVVLAAPGIDEIGPLPPNVEVHGWLPMSVVLEHADAFLCHAGMGTLMAGLARAVPIVAVPESPEAMVNAARIAELGLGAVLAKDAVTPERLRDTVSAVAADRRIRARARAMRDDIRATGGGPAGADAIEAYLAAVRTGHSGPGEARSA